MFFLAVAAFGLLLVSFSYFYGLKFLPANSETSKHAMVLGRIPSTQSRSEPETRYDVEIGDKQISASSSLQVLAELNKSDALSVTKLALR
jgi:hypothetical protein